MNVEREPIDYSRPLDRSCPPYLAIWLLYISALRTQSASTRFSNGKASVKVLSGAEKIYSEGYRVGMVMVFDSTCRQCFPMYGLEAVY